jgi:hypothetical protein
MRGGDSSIRYNGSRTSASIPPLICSHSVRVPNVDGICCCRRTGILVGMGVRMNLRGF